MSVASSLQRRESSLHSKFQEYSKDSFLYEKGSKEYKDFNPNTLRLSAVQALEKLSKIENHWEKYLSLPLFTEVPAPRELGQKSENNQLSSKLSKVLFLLSKYFLLRETHEILEYLVRCFGVHKYEAAAVLKCILPYHETNLFTLMVRIIDFTSLPPFKFLKTEVAATGMPPSKATLAQRMIKDRFLLEFVFLIPMTYAKTKTSYQHVHCFYASIMIQLLAINDVDRSTLSVILHHTNQGIASNDAELQIACYMIVSSLLLRISVESTISLESLEGNIVRSAIPHLHYHALLTLIITQQNKSEKRPFSKVLVLELIDWNDLESTLTQIVQSEEYDCEPFFNNYLPTLAKLATENTKVAKHIYYILQSIPKLKKYIATFTYDLLTNFSNEKTVLKPNIVKVIQSCFIMMDNKYPLELEKGISEITKEGEKLNFENGWDKILVGTRHQFFTLDCDEEEGRPIGLISTIQHSLSITTPPAMVIQALKSLQNIVFRKETWSEKELGGEDEDANSKKSLTTILASSIFTFLCHPQTKESILLYILKELKGFETIMNNTELLEILDQLLQSLTENPKKTKEADEIVTAIQEFMLGPLLNHNQDLKNRIFIIFLRQLFQRNLNETKRKILFNNLLDLNHSLLKKKTLPKISKITFESCFCYLIEAIGKELVSQFSVLTEEFIGNIAKENLELWIFSRLVVNSSLFVDTDSVGVKQKLIYFLIDQLAGDIQGSGVLTYYNYETQKGASIFNSKGLPTWTPQQFIDLLSKSKFSNIHHLSLKNILQVLNEDKNISQEDKMKIWRCLFMILFSNRFSMEEAQMIWDGSMKQLLKEDSFIPVLTYFWSVQHGFSENLIVTALDLFKPNDGRTGCGLLAIIAKNVMNLFVSLLSPSKRVRQKGFQVIGNFVEMLKASKNHSENTKYFEKQISSAINYDIFVNLLTQVSSFGEEIANGLQSLTPFYEHLFKKDPKKKDAVGKFLLELCLAEREPYIQYCNLNGLGSFNSESKFLTLVQYLEKKFKSTRKTGQTYFMDEYDRLVAELIFSQFNYNNAQSISSSDYLFPFFCQFIKGDDIMICTEQKKTTGGVKTTDFSPCLFLLGQISPAFFSLFSFSKQQAIFSILCTLLMPTLGTKKSGADVSLYRTLIKEAVRRVLKLIPPSEHLVDTELRQCVQDISVSDMHGREVLERTEKVSTKRSRTNTGKASESSVLPPKDAALLAEQQASGKSKLIVLLETHEYRTNLFSHLHIEYLCTILGHFIDPVLVEKDVTAEYTQQLLLKSLTVICQTINNSIKASLEPTLKRQASENDFDMHVEEPKKFSEEDIKKIQEKFNIDALIEVMRSSNSPTIHNSCLLLLTELAKLFPEVVFKNMMTICVFLGVSARRIEYHDIYTLGVIQRTIESIVPALLNSEAGRGIQINLLIEEIVIQFDSIPEHRRLLFFSILSKTLGQKYIPILFLTMFCQSLVTSATGSSIVVKGSILSKPEELLKFMNFLCLKSQPDAILRSLQFLLHSLSKLSLESFNDPTKDKSTNTVKDLTNSTILTYAKKLHKNLNESSFKYFLFQIESCIIELLVNYLSDHSFENQMLTVATIRQEKIQTYYLQMFQLLMICIQNYNSQIDSMDFEERTQTEKKKIIATRDLGEVLIVKVNDHLTLGNFITVIGALLKNENPKIQSQALLILNDKMKSQTRTPSHSHCMQLMELTTKLVEVITHVSSDGKESETVTSTKQTAALSIEILARWLAGVPEYSDFFVDLIPALLEELKIRTEKRKNSTVHVTGNTRVESSLLLVLAMLTTQLVRSESLLPHINSLFDALLECLTCHSWKYQEQPAQNTIEKAKKSKKKKNNNTPINVNVLKKEELLLVMSAFSAVKAILGKMGRFFTHKMGALLSLLLKPALTQQSSTSDEIKESLKIIGSNYSMHELLNQINQSYDVLVTQASECKFLSIHVASFGHFFDFITSLFRHLTSAQVQQEHKEIFEFLKKTFDIKHSLGAVHVKENPELVKEIEGMAISTLSPFVTNLTDKLFKPLFVSLVSWLDVVDNKIRKQYRKNIFYRIVFKLTELLQSIFVPYYENIFQFIVKDLVLDKQQQTNAESYELIQYILEALKLCFMFDKSKFITVDRFEKLLPSLIGVMAQVGPTTVQYRKRIQDYYVPCIIQLVINLGNEDIWKVLNFQFLQKMRDDNPDVRHSTLTVIYNLFLKIGEQYLPLLPESMPYLFEVLEDPDESVEQVVLKLKSTLSDLLGEENFQELLQ